MELGEKAERLTLNFLKEHGYTDSSQNADFKNQNSSRDITAVSPKGKTVSISVKSGRFFMPRVGHIDQHGEWIYMYDATRPRHNEIDDILNRKFDFAFYWDSDNLNNESLEPRAIVPCSKLKSYLKTWRLKEDVGGLEIEYAFDKYFKDQFVEDLKDGTLKREYFYQGTFNDVRYSFIVRKNKSDEVYEDYSVFYILPITTDFWKPSREEGYNRIIRG